MESNDKKRICNLYILGNGFDLLLGLPTRFSDFIEFCKIYDYFIEHINDTKEGIATYNFDDKLDEYKTLKITDDLLSTFPCIYDEVEKQCLYNLKKQIDNSIFIKYCISLEKENNYRWSSFEKYLLFLCESFEEYITNVTDLKDIKNNINYINSELKKFLEIMQLKKGCFNFDVGNPYREINTSNFLKSSLDESRIEFIDSLYNGLCEFNKIFNTYIKLFVCKIEIINNISRINSDNTNSYVINFNYTWNEQLLISTKYNHIHGLTVDDNIIIGINSEKLPIEYMKLQKKFMSINNRIENFTKSEKDKNYYDVEEWLGECQNFEKNKFSVSVIGHSLDSIDDYILKSIFNSPLLGQIYLYYHNEKSKLTLLSNLCRIMGYEKVEHLLVGFPNIFRFPIEDLRTGG